MTEEQIQNELNPEGLLFRVIDWPGKREWRIYADGRIEGFPEGCIIFNNYLLLRDEAIDRVCNRK